VVTAAAKNADCGHTNLKETTMRYTITTRPTYEEQRDRLIKDVFGGAIALLVVVIVGTLFTL
jgi:hypothetical protein